MTRGLPSVFVYGSLKRGFHNWSKFLGASKFQGEYTTTDMYLMYGKGEDFPLVRGLRTSDNWWFKGNIVGEVYQVTLHTLNRLDTLEGHPDFFVRKQVTLEGHLAKVWMYLWADEDGHIEDSLCTPSIGNIHKWERSYE